MRRIDYDTEQYQDYARGRALTERQLQAWISAFGAQLPAGRPLAGLDVGSGTGRFTPALARAFGPVTGWRVASFGTVTEPSSGTRGDMLERLRLRTLSFFAHLSPDELEAGFRRLEQAVAADPGAPAPALSEPLLTLERR